MERWQMNRFGFVNFWVYDVEEFTPENGKILLRGSNGSGKSITTQSFIPYILDGDRQPSRLDPFGSRDRKMEFYLIGDKDSGKDESTGYIWMEFVKPDGQQYRTIGIGLHAKRGRNMNTWGFCLMDGRRIGMDFSLYKAVGSTIIPHDARTLKKNLGEQNIFTDKTSDYKLMVADKIFGIPKERIDDFDQLTNILIKTRSSKLASKENLRPTQLYAILNESLQTLSDYDLHPMADAMSKIEDAHNKIEIAVQALGEAKYIADEYDRYNRYMLWLKAVRYLKKYKECRKTQSEADSTKKEIQHIQDEIQQYARQSETIQQTMDNLHIELDNLDISDIQEQLKKKEETERYLLQTQKNSRDKQQRMEEKTKILTQKYGQYKKYNTVLEKKQAEISRLLEEMTCYQQHHFPFYDVFLATLQSEEVLPHESYKKEYQCFQEKIRKASYTIRQYEVQHEVYDKSQEKLAQLQYLYQQAELSLQEVTEVLDNQKNEMIERLYISVKKNTQYIIDDVTLKQAEYLITHYESQGSANEYNRLLAESKMSLMVKQETLLWKLKQEKKNIQEKLNEINRHLAQLRNMTDPVPERSAKVTEARKALQENGIDFYSFYECIDFKESIPQETRALIEAQITDMGLLDALVIPDNQKEKAMAVLSRFSDSYLIPDESDEKHDNTCFEIVIPKSDFSDVTKRILSAFANKVSISSEGYYRNGILSGHSVAEKDVCFIGAENRKKYRQQQIDLLEQQYNEIKILYDECESKIIAVADKKRTLEQEFDKTSDISDLNTAVNLVSESQRNLDNALKNFREQESICGRQKTKLSELYQKREEVCLEFPNCEKTVRFFERLLTDTENYIQLLLDSIVCIKEKGNAEQLCRNIREQIEQAENDKNQFGKELDELENRMAQYRLTITLCDQFLNAPENIDRSHRIDDIRQQLILLEKDKKNSDDNIVRFKERITHIQDNLTKIQQNLQTIAEQEKLLAEYFSEELELGFVMSKENKTLKDCAEKSVLLVSAGDDRKSINDISQRLFDCYRKHANILSADYKPLYGSFFENPDAETVRSRVKITLVWQSRAVSPTDFKNALENSVEHDKLLLRTEEENMFKDILLNTISKKLSRRIRESNEWVKSMCDMMSEIRTSMGLTFRLVWTPKRDMGKNELRFDELNKLLSKDKQWINANDIEKLTKHFRSKIEYERKKREELGEDINYADIIKDVLDFRNWFEFVLKYKDPKMKEFKELTNSRFNTFSGGERALSLYIPLFTAVSAQYEKAGEQAPKILALDEAFAGVDDNNISEMFALLEKLKFGYIVNSQALWGCYDSVSALEIAELFHDKDSDFITVIKYKWNGKQKILQV